MQTHDFQLYDARGNTHDYTVSPHPTSEGTMLVVRLLGMAGGPIGRLASSNLDVLIDLVPKMIAEYQDQSQGGKEMTDQEFMIALQKELGDLSDLDLDFQAILADILSAIVQAGGDEFIRSLLAHTFRDGQKLSQDALYDTAYQANYGELFKAIWEVIKANGFLLSLGIS